jgi:hypothetical protein
VKERMRERGRVKEKEKVRVNFNSHSKVTQRVLLLKIWQLREELGLSNS